MQHAEVEWCPLKTAAAQTVASFYTSSGLLGAMGHSLVYKSRLAHDVSAFSLELPSL
jgi:hypothetical protein